ncbi:MAG: DUF3089 domain-containing protein [Micromonosporaceae bacterium]|nr:DUF3089 domain-containing protein [Micromonosporaceae bacterium]
MSSLGLAVSTLALAGVAGCESGDSKADSEASATSALPSATDTVWLCRPGMADNPCLASLDVTTVRADGSTTITTQATPTTSSAVDCFYVYPTVSKQTTMNADLTIEVDETAAAFGQASRFSQSCNVWAPMYRQGTLAALAKGMPLDPDVMNTAYQSLLSGWQDYLAHHNQGRPLIFIGHSQGASMLMQLLSSQVDENEALRRQMVSAILLGGNVEVPTVAGGAGTFKNIPACRYAEQTGCVIAYSTYPGQPPEDSGFGRPGKGISKGQDEQTIRSTQVLCVNPAALSGGTASADSYFPTAAFPTPGTTVTTPWIGYPGRYTITCKSAGDATWLEAAAVPGDARQSLVEKDPKWGFHSYDVFLPLGDLIRAVQNQMKAYEITK